MVKSTCLLLQIASAKSSRKSRRSRSSSSSSSFGSASSVSSSSSSSAKSDNSTFSDIRKAKSEKFRFKKPQADRLCKWIVRRINEKDVKAARESFKPAFEPGKKFVGVDLFTNPKLDETLFSALKSVRNSNAAVTNIDLQEKIYRRQADLVLDMAKPLLFLTSRSKKKKKAHLDRRALKTLLMLWTHLFRDITMARRLNIMSQVHPNHIGLLNHSAKLLPVGGEDLFGDSFIKELLSQVQTAGLVSNSSSSAAATPASTIRSGSNKSTRPLPPKSRPFNLLVNKQQESVSSTFHTFFYCACCRPHSLICGGLGATYQGPLGSVHRGSRLHVRV